MGAVRLVHSLQEAEPLCTAVEGELLAELLQDAVRVGDERRVEAADGFGAAQERHTEGCLGIRLTRQSAAPATCRTGLVLLISARLGVFQSCPAVAAHPAEPSDLCWDGGVPTQEPTQEPLELSPSCAPLTKLLSKSCPSV